MPIYEYECLTCNTIFEKRQSFNDDAGADCPQGHTQTRRLIAAPAIVFKGSGFYVNDSKSSKNGASDTNTVSKTTEGKADSTSENKVKEKKESSE